MATTKNLQTLTINRLSLAKYRALAAANSINPEQLYELSNKDELLTKTEVLAAINSAVKDGTAGVLRSVKWEDIQNKPDMGNYATIAKVEQLVNALINQAPGMLDTFKEIADALGNDPNLATTLLTKINAKADKAATEAALNGKADKVNTEQALATKTSVTLKEWGE